MEKQLVRCNRYKDCPDTTCGDYLPHEVSESCVLATCPHLNDRTVCVPYSEEPDDMVDLLHGLFCTHNHEDDSCTYYAGDKSVWIAYTKEARSIFPDLDKALREAREILNLMETNSTGKRLIKFFTPQP